MPTHSPLLTLWALSANVFGEISLVIPFVRAKMDLEGNVVDAGLKENLGRSPEILLRVISYIYDEPNPQ